MIAPQQVRRVTNRVLTFVEECPQGRGNIRRADKTIITESSPSLLRREVARGRPAEVKEKSRLCDNTCQVCLFSNRVQDLYLLQLKTQAFTRRRLLPTGQFQQGYACLWWNFKRWIERPTQTPASIRPLTQSASRALPVPCHHTVTLKRSLFMHTGCGEAADHVMAPRSRTLPPTLIKLGLHYTAWLTLTDASVWFAEVIHHSAHWNTLSGL